MTPKPARRSKEKWSLYEALKKHDCDIEQYLALAIKNQHIPLIRAITELMPFIAPKYKDIDQIDEKPKAPAAAIGETNLENIIKIARG